jgi:hypothetical protein
MYNATWTLFQYRNKVNEKVSDNVGKHLFKFTKDSVFLFSGDIIQAVAWEKGKLAFTLISTNHVKSRYEWIFGSTDEACFIVNDNKQKVECYKKVH